MTTGRYAALVWYFGSSFLMHFAWEHLQMPLFDLPPMSSLEAIWLCLFATATGDMLFMLLIYASIAAAHRNWYWMSNPHAYRAPATWVLPLIVGALLAISYELWAVYAEGKWKYGTMPLVPVLRVGIAPLLQMIVIPLVAIALCGWRAGRSTASAA